jgi:hypothetical protein
MEGRLLLRTKGNDKQSKDTLQLRNIEVFLSHHLNHNRRDVNVHYLHIAVIDHILRQDYRQHSQRKGIGLVD